MANPFDDAVGGDVQSSSTNPFDEVTGAIKDATKSVSDSLSNITDETVESLSGKVSDTKAEIKSKITESEAAAKAQELITKGKQEFEAVVAETKANPIGTAKGVIDEAGEAADVGGTALGKGIRWLADKASDSFSKSMDAYGKAKLFEAEGNVGLGNVQVDWLRANGPQILETASDVALLYAIWIIPIVPPQYKIAATISVASRALAIASLSTPVLVKFVAGVAKGAGAPMDEAMIAGMIDKAKLIENAHPGLIIRKFLYDTSKSFAEGTTNAGDGDAAGWQAESDKFSGQYNRGGQINAMRAKFYNKGGMTEAEGWAAESKKYADANLDVGSMTPKEIAGVVLDNTPVIGDIRGAIEVAEMIKAGPKSKAEWALIGALAGATVIGLFPGVGDAAASAIKAGARAGLKGVKGGVELAKRIEVDPNAVGSLGGNIRLKAKS